MYSGMHCRAVLQGFTEGFRDISCQEGPVYLLQHDHRPTVELETGGYFLLTNLSIHQLQPCPNVIKIAREVRRKDQLPDVKRSQTSPLSSTEKKKEKKNHRGTWVGS